ncbi:hypothetical protein MLD38_019993 [Melastoma candidum]|uniref:Uncharacterized protein n=1 Tax=Melastoma candidum TaxID=119954 RepID=A0ACB9QBK4_9MYRT|nr:hypothetical protein MLD38_019993 [Melastoma candidum]
MRPAPYHRNIPHYHSKGRSSRGCCRRCLCCFCCFLFLLVVVIASIVLYFFAAYSPMIPSYSINSFETNTFNMGQDFSLYAEFLVTVKAVNPNEHISFIYGQGSSVEVVYVDSPLCKGEIPAFEQGHMNMTMIKILLKGKSEFGSSLQTALMESRHTGRIPLIVKVKVPVVVVIGSTPLNEMKVKVDCTLVVDNLSPQKTANIISNVCVPTIEP